MGRHTDPNEKNKGKYVVVGLAALLLAGGVCFGATRILNNTAEKPKEAVTARESQSSSKKESAVSSTKKSAKKPTKNSSEKKEKTKKTTESSKKKTKTSNSSEKQASSEKKSTSKAKKKTAAKLDASALTQSAGKVYYGVQYLKSKQEFSSNNSERTIAANIIELFIMDYALAQKDGSNQVIEDKPLNEWLTPMIQQNDINATNVLIDHYEMGNMNSYFKDQGYPDTYIERRMVDINVRSTDKDNYTSLNDCMKLLKKIYDGRDKEPQKTMLDILKGQVIRTKIPAKLPNNITGEQQNVENDIGIVLTKDNPFVIVILTNDVSDIVKTRTAISEFSLAATKIKE